MKKALLIAFLFLNLKTFGQDMIYLANGNSVLGKITEITTDTIKYKNLANPLELILNYSPAKVRLAFNATGSYLIFNPLKPASDEENNEFIETTAKRRTFDIAVDLNGKLSAFAILSETETEISDGEDVRLSKDSLAFIIRKNGNHEFFCAVEKALPYLINSKSKIDTLLAHPPEIPVVDQGTGPDASKGLYVPPDRKWFGRKAFEKIQLFAYYLQAINSVNNNKGPVTDFTDRACNLFLNTGLDSWVDVSETKTSEKTKYKLRDYLATMKKMSGQFSKVVIENINVDYCTKFIKGPDGNNYGTVTFIQNFSGFNDGNLIFRKQTKCNITMVALPHYSGPFRKEMSGWDLYLDSIGIVETKKL